MIVKSSTLYIYIALVTVTSSRQSTNSWSIGPLYFLPSLYRPIVLPCKTIVTLIAFLNWHEEIYSGWPYQSFSKTGDNTAISSLSLQTDTWMQAKHPTMIDALSRSWWVVEYGNSAGSWLDRWIGIILINIGCRRMDLGSHRNRANEKCSRQRVLWLYYFNCCKSDIITESPYVVHADPKSAGVYHLFIPRRGLRSTIDLCISIWRRYFRMASIYDQSRS